MIWFVLLVSVSLSGTDLNASTAWNRYFFLQKMQMGKWKLEVTHDIFKLESFFRVKEGQAQLHRLNVVYHIHCSCGSNYIGETTRNLPTARAAVATLVRLPEFCQHDSTNTIAAPNVKTRTLLTISLKIPTIKLTLLKLKYLELPVTELSFSFWKL